MDLYVAEEVMRMNAESAVKEEAQAASRQQAQPSRIRVGHRGAWLSRQTCRMLAGLGWRLVALSKRLERYGQGSMPQIDSRSAPV
jgi:hypothetical protein